MEARSRPRDPGPARAPDPGQIEIAVYLTPPDRRPRDASNYVKGIEDPQ